MDKSEQEAVQGVWVSQEWMLERQLLLPWEQEVRLTNSHLLLLFLW